MNIRIKILLALAVVLLSVTGMQAADDYKETPEFLVLRDSMHHAFNDGDSARFFHHVKVLQDYLLRQDDLHAYYTQRCNEIVFLLNQQSVFEAYKLATALSQELLQRKLDKEMYMAYNMMGHIYNYSGNQENAKQCFWEVIHRMEKAGYEESMAPIYMNLVNVEMDLNNPDEAMRLLDKAVEIAAKASPQRLFDIETRRTLLYYTNGDMDKFNEGYKAYQDGLSRGLSSVHGRELEVYHTAEQGQIDKAVGIAMSELGNTERWDAITKIYERAGLWQKAYESLKQENLAVDSINSVILSNSMQGIQSEMKIHAADRKASQYFIGGLLTFVILLILLLLAMAYIYNSRRRHMRQLERAYQHALESDKMKAAFIQNISHELRTPLNIINGYAQVLSSPDYDISASEREEISRTMIQNADIITTLVNETLELSSMEAGANAERKDKVQLQRLVKNVVHHRQQTAEHPVEVNFNSTLTPDFEVMTSEVLLRRIVDTLVDNAFKNTAQGSITVRTSAADEQLTISVEDSGTGIPAGEEEHIFERFVKLNDFKPGLGLGLTLCRALCQRLGGNVVLDPSYAGPGARFVVTLPL
ncbi:MAG: HAMP domain-containing histidine kinase [Prevotella sp.]|nr:HAMP domain-containing histidine kinase [Prevotella sp.]